MFGCKLLLKIKKPPRCPDADSLPPPLQTHLQAPAAAPCGDDRLLQVCLVSSGPPGSGWHHLASWAVQASRAKLSEVNIQGYKTALRLCCMLLLDTVTNRHGSGGCNGSRPPNVQARCQCLPWELQLLTRSGSRSLRCHSGRHCAWSPWGCHWRCCQGW
jgi:hypothetical protein